MTASHSARGYHELPGDGIKIVCVTLKPDYVLYHRTLEPRHVQRRLDLASWVVIKQDNGNNFHNSVLRLGEANFSSYRQRKLTQFPEKLAREGGKGSFSADVNNSPDSELRWEEIVLRFATFLFIFPFVPAMTPSLRQTANAFPRVGYPFRAYRRYRVRPSSAI